MSYRQKQTEHDIDTRPRRSSMLAIAAIGLSSFTTVLIVAKRARFRELIADFELPSSLVTCVACNNTYYATADTQLDELRELIDQVVASYLTGDAGRFVVPLLADGPSLAP